MKDLTSKVKRRLEYLSKRKEEIVQSVHSMEEQMVQLRTEYLTVVASLEELSKLIENNDKPKEPKPESEANNTESK